MLGKEDALLQADQDPSFCQLTAAQHLAQLATLLKSTFSVILSYLFEIFVMSINLHVTGNWPDQVHSASLGLAVVLIHSLGGSLAQGMNQGFTTMAGRAFGIKDERLMQEYNHKQLGSLGLSFCFLAVLMCASYKLALLMGQDERVAWMSCLYGVALLPAFLIYYIFDWLRSYMNSVGIFTPVSLILIVSAVIHIVLSTLLGGWVFWGPVVVTTITYILAVIMQFYYLTKIQNPMPDSLTFPRTESFDYFKDYFKEVLVVALPLVIDLFTFEVNSLIIGSFHVDSMTAANISVANFVSTLYCMSFGLGGAVCTVGSQYIGQRKVNKLKNLLVYATLFSMFFVVTNFFILSNQSSQHSVAAFYSINLDTQGYMIMVFNLFRWFVLPDYQQAFLGSFVKVLGFSAELMRVYVFAFYLFSIPLSFYLAFGLDMQLRGVWMSFGMAILLILGYMMYRLSVLDWSEHVIKRSKEIVRQKISH